MHNFCAIKALGCDDPPIYEETIKTEQARNESTESTENQDIEEPAANTEETVTRTGCEIADPRNNQNTHELQFKCEGGIDQQKNEMLYPWFKLCCTWIDHSCKRKTGRNLKPKGTVLGISFCFKMKLKLLTIGSHT